MPSRVRNPTPPSEPNCAIKAPPGFSILLNGTTPDDEDARWLEAAAAVAADLPLFITPENFNQLSDAGKRMAAVPMKTPKDPDRHAGGNRFRLRNRVGQTSEVCFSLLLCYNNVHTWLAGWGSPQPGPCRS